jgi:hypothetical protein
MPLPRLPRSLVCKAYKIRGISSLERRRAPSRLKTGICAPLAHHIHTGFPIGACPTASITAVPRGVTVPVSAAAPRPRVSGGVLPTSQAIFIGRTAICADRMGRREYSSSSSSSSSYPSPFVPSVAEHPGLQESLGTAPPGADQAKMYTTAFAFFEAMWDAGVTHCFVNLGSDHPSIIEAMVKGQREGKGFPRIITCPNEVCVCWSPWRQGRNRKGKRKGDKNES